MNSFAFTIQVPLNTPELKQDVSDTSVSDTSVSSTMETPEWPTGNESFYNNRMTAYTWDDVVLTPADVRRAAFNEAVYNALKQREQREKQLMAHAVGELANICANVSHVIQICDWVWLQN